MKGLEPHPCIIYLVWFTDSLCHGSLCAWRLTVLSLLRPDVAPAFFLSSRPALPCPPASCPWFSSCSWCCPCLSCLACILCASALSPVSVMRAAFVVVLVPVSPCLYPCSVLHLFLSSPCPCSCVCVVSYACWCPHPCMQSYPYLVSLCRPGGAYASVCLGVVWRRHVSPSPAKLETWRVKPSQ